MTGNFIFTSRASSIFERFDARKRHRHGQLWRICWERGLALQALCASTNASRSASYYARHSLVGRIHDLSVSARPWSRPGWRHRWRLRLTVSFGHSEAGNRALHSFRNSWQRKLSGQLSRGQIQRSDSSRSRFRHRHSRRRWLRRSGCSKRSRRRQ